MWGSHYGLVLYPHGAVALGEPGPSAAYSWAVRVCYPTFGMALASVCGGGGSCN